MKELFQLPDELQATFELLVLTRRRLQEDMTGVRADGSKDPSNMAAKGGFNPAHLAGLEKLAVAQTKLGTEMRQWSGHQKSSLDKMPPAQKARVVVQFIQTELPMGARRELYEVLVKEEAKRTHSDSLPLNLGPPGSTVE